MCSVVIYVNLSIFSIKKLIIHIQGGIGKKILHYSPQPCQIIICTLKFINYPLEIVTLGIHKASPATVPHLKLQRWTKLVVTVFRYFVGIS